MSIVARATSERASSACKVLIHKCRQYSTRTINENDVVLLRSVKDTVETRPILTEPLTTGKTVKVYKGHIPHADIIGKRLRHVVSATTKRPYRIHEPTLDEYVKLTPRLVTPIYSADANLMVSLLELHPPLPGEECSIDIFEAGTGHGGLTLHLARAVYGFNAATSMTTSSATAGTIPKPLINTLDISTQHSLHAQKIIDQFRHGLYSNLVRFHVGSITKYIAVRLAQDSSPFLSHAILDLPACHTYMDEIGKVLRPNGILMVFCPNITQIIRCTETVKSEKLPLWLENVVELGAGAGVGGKEWDIRAVRPRSILRAEQAARSQAGEVGPNVAAGKDDSTADSEGEPLYGDPSTKSKMIDSGWEMVCRPRPGLRVYGGGFIGLFRKKEDLDMQT